MGSCEETTQLVSDGLDRELTTGERLRLRFHLLFCKHCANVERQFSLIRTFMTRLGERAGEDLDRHATQSEQILFNRRRQCGICRDECETEHRLHPRR